jgi:hypothetical protein
VVPVHEEETVAKRINETARSCLFSVTPLEEKDEGLKMLEIMNADEALLLQYILNIAET